MGFWFGSPACLPEHDQLELAGDVLAYRIRASRRRRTLALELRPDGSLIVAAPSGAPLTLIRRFVSSQQQWIATRRARLVARPGVLALVTGATLPLLDATVTLALRLVPGPSRCVQRGAVLEVRAANQRAARATLERWYRRAAAEYFHERLTHFVPRVGRAPTKLTIRAPRTRWGSCSARGTISLHWRLLTMPAPLADYVLVHELCHLLEPNHSPRFWAEVARVLPDWPAHRAALRHAGRRPLWIGACP